MQSNPAHSPVRRAALAARSASGALALALSSAAGLLAAFAALLPAALRGGPMGRAVEGRSREPALDAAAPGTAERALPR